MGMRHSLKRLLFEQVGGASLIKNTDENAMFQVSRMLAANDFSTDGTVGEDIIALLTGGQNTNEGRSPTTFKDVVADGVAISVKGAAKAGTEHGRVARNSINLSAGKIQKAKSDRVALIIVTVSADHRQLELTIFGPTDTKDAINRLGGEQGPNTFKRSFLGVRDVFHSQADADGPVEMKLPIPDSNADAMKMVYEIPNAVLLMRSGDEIADYLRGVATDIEDAWSY
jgi:hypothetical protein